MELFGWAALTVLSLAGALVVVHAIARRIRNNRRYRRLLTRVNNALLRNEFGQSFPFSFLSDHFGARNTRDTDISDHLSELFYDVVSQKPRFIVELGTRGGESTRVLLSAARLLDVPVLSVDINECPVELPTEYAERWNFVQADDVAFGKERFAGWCAERGYEPTADLIFLDTSHLYEHTVEELAAWMPLLAPGGLIIFHDTNMQAWVYRRLDNSVGVGANNDRGVIRAIEEYLGRSYDESTAFSDVVGEYLVRHRPHCNGYTVIRKRS